MKRSALVSVMAIAIAMSASASAQDRPFVFSVTTPPPSASTQMRVDLDVGAGDEAFRASQGNGPEQRVGVQISRGRLTFIGRFDIATNGASSYDTSQSGEALVSFGPRGVALAAGGGVLHEADGVDVLLGRVVAGRETDLWRLHGNMVLQKPLRTPGRDALDLLTTVGWARKLTRSVALGVEAIGEDLEGFWDTEEAEGGARLLAGPTVHVSPGGAWQLTVTGGPTLHPNANRRASDAIRDLPASTNRVGYAARLAFTVALF